MKLKSTLLVISGLLAGALTSNAASFIVSNVVSGPGDTLYANNDNSLMNGGIVTIGYFNVGITADQIDTIPELFANLSNFTIVTAYAPGSPSAILGASLPGYADQADATDIGTITGANALIGRTVYSIISSASTLASASLNSEFALVQIGNILDDVPVPQSYSSNPVSAPIIGSLDTFVGDTGAGEGTYKTLKMAVVPEPSAALLGAIGVLGLLRRRRA